MAGHKYDSYVYQLVKFIVRWPRTTKKIDMVPCDWVSLNKKSGKIVTKFMPPPYTEERCGVLQNLVKTLGDPLDDWPEYNVIIKGCAMSFHEAEKRLQTLQTEEYAFSMESDMTPEEKAVEAVRKIERNKLKVSAEAEAALHNVPDLNSDYETEIENIAANVNQKSSKNKTLANSARKCYGGKEFIKTPDVLKINTRTECSSQLNKMFVNGKSGARTKSIKNKNVKTNLTTDSAAKWDDSDESLLDIEHTKEVHQTGSKLLYENAYSDSDGEKHKELENLSIFNRKHISFQPKIQIGSQSVVNKSKEKLGKKRDKTNDCEKDQYLKEKKPHRPKRGRITSDSELLWEIYHDLQKVKVDLDEIKANQRLEQEARHNALIEQGAQDNFLTKYNLDLPFCTKAEFDEFCGNLLTNDDYRKKFMKSLNKLFDRTNIASRSLTNIVKKYLSSELAVQFTAIKQMPNKFLMRTTPFFDCLLGVIADTHKDQNGKFITESTFSSLLGNVLSNAKDWKGNRRKRGPRHTIDGDEEDVDML